MEYWTWLIIGAVLVLLEVLTPTLIILWFGVAALIMAGVAYFAPGLDWELQVVLFVGISVVSVVLSKVLGARYRHERTDDGHRLNQRCKDFIGKVYVVTSAVEGGRGHVSINHTPWLCCSEEDLPTGAKVRVVGVDGAILEVEQVSEQIVDEAEN